MFVIVQLQFIDMQQTLIKNLLYMFIVQAVIYNLALSPELNQPGLFQYSELMGNS